MFEFETVGENSCAVRGVDDSVIIRVTGCQTYMTTSQAMTLERQLATLNHARREWEQAQRAASLGVTVAELRQGDRADRETVRRMTADLGNLLEPQEELAR